MHISSAKLTFYMPHATSLKDKRQICRSLLDKTRHRFNASVAEVGAQDVHQTLSVGIAAVSGDAAHVQRYVNEIIRYMEEATDADLIEIDIL